MKVENLEAKNEKRREKNDECCAIAMEWNINQYLHEMKEVDVAGTVE